MLWLWLSSLALWLGFFVCMCKVFLPKVFLQKLSWRHGKISFCEGDITFIYLTESYVTNFSAVVYGEERFSCMYV
jgi:hypothetical protein